MCNEYKGLGEKGGNNTPLFGHNTPLLAIKGVSHEKKRNFFFEQKTP
jgi:hypothetical protein